MMNQTGKYIKQKRIEKEVTREELAQLAKVLVSQVSSFLGWYRALVQDVP